MTTTTPRSPQRDAAAAFVLGTLALLPGVTFLCLSFFGRSGASQWVTALAWLVPAAISYTIGVLKLRGRRTAQAGPGRP
jgi:hypothetical protein